MENNHFSKILEGYQAFRKQYAQGNQSIMRYLSDNGQQPEIMVVACCDSRVDPALILQCDPGDLFVVRNVANIVPPNELDDKHHGTSAALEFGVRFLKVRHLILLGHSQCGGIQARLNQAKTGPNDFINHWVSQINMDTIPKSTDDYACSALHQSYDNCLTFPWIREALAADHLTIHRWFFDIKKGQIFSWSDTEKKYQSLS